MRTSQLPTLAACLSIGGLAVWAALGSMHDVAVAAPLDTVTSSECQALPAPTPSASASASASGSASPTGSASTPAPADLCISVQASADTVQAGQAATWTVDVWAPNGPVYGVTVTLTGTLAGQTPTFTSGCPGGNGNDNCTVATLDTATAPESDSMQAQITIPSGTAASTSVTLTATADAVPALPTAATAATVVTTTVAASASASPTPTKSASPSASASKGSTSTSAATATTTPGKSAGTTLTPGIGTVPNYTGAVTPATGVSAVTNPGSITSLLPAITPGASTPSPTAGLDTSPAADNPAGATVDRASNSNYDLVVPVATAEKIGGIILLFMAGLIIRLRLRGKKKVVPSTASGNASDVAKSGGAPTRRREPLIIVNLRRHRGDSTPGPDTTPSPSATPTATAPATASAAATASASASTTGTGTATDES